MTDAPPPDLRSVLAGDLSSVSYTLSDMAADAVGLLDALGFERAHVVGASLCASHPINCSILLQHLLVLGVSLAVYAKPRCSAFIASLTEVIRLAVEQAPTITCTACRQYVQVISSVCGAPHLGIPRMYTGLHETHRSGSIVS